MSESPPQRTPRRIIAAVALGAALVPLNSTMVAVALPSIGQRFDADAGTLTLWLVTSYLFVNILLQSPAGKVGDLIGRRRAFYLGQGLFAAGTLFGVLIPHLAAVAASRVLMAAGGAMVVPTAMALLRTVIPEHARPRAFGYFGALLGISAATGPLLGGLLTQAFGWEAIFLVNLPLLAISWLLVRSDRSVSAESSDSAPRARFDFTGMALLFLGLGSVVIGMKVGGAWMSGLIPLGLAGLVAFGLWEKRTPAPLIDPTLAGRRPFVIGGTVVGLQNLGMYALLFQLPFLFNAWFELDAARSGQLLLTMTLAMVFGSPLGGRLAERLGTKTTILAGISLSLIGLLAILRATEAESLIGIGISLGCIGGGIGMVMGPAQAAALSSVSPGQSGVASGVLATARYLGGIIGITIISVVLGNVADAELLARNQLCIVIYIGAHVVALALAFMLPGGRTAHGRRA